MMAPRMKSDERIILEIDGTRQTLRLRTRRPGSPPLLVVQAGPGLPLLNEVGRWERSLVLEDDFTVAYWEQRGCGAAPAEDAGTVTWQTQESDLTFVLDWLFRRTGQKVLVVGVSFGATLALGAAARVPQQIRAVVGLSTDTDIPAADEAVYKAMVAANPRLADLRPPYLDPQRFQARAQHLANLGSIEAGKGFGRILVGLLSSLVAAYGPLGVPRVLANMAAVQGRLLDPMSRVVLLAAWPETKVPIHLVFGEDDLLVPPAVVEGVREHLGKDDTLTTLAGAGHLVHFDRPREVRELIRAVSTT